MDTLVRVIIHDVSDEVTLIGDTTSKYVGNWKLLDVATNDTIESDTTIMTEYEQLFIDLGFSVSIQQPYVPGPIKIGKIPVDSDLISYYEILAPNNGLIESTISYSDSSHRWLSGVSDVDVPLYALDWIRSGTYQSDVLPGGDDWEMSGSPAKTHGILIQFTKKYL